MFVNGQVFEVTCRDVAKARFALLASSPTQSTPAFIIVLGRIPISNTGLCKFPLTIKTPVLPIRYVVSQDFGPAVFACAMRQRGMCSFGMRTAGAVAHHPAAPPACAHRAPAPWPVCV